MDSSLALEFISSQVVRFLVSSLCLLLVYQVMKKLSKQKDQLDKALFTLVTIFGVLYFISHWSNLEGFFALIRVWLIVGLKAIFFPASNLVKINTSQIEQKSEVS